jgi:NAD+ kinase
LQTRSTPGSSAQSGKAVQKAALVLHGRRDTVAEAVPRVRELAQQHGVELVDADDEGALEADIALVLGGDGTMLRTLGRFLGTGIPVAGVNFGAVGFLTSIPRTHLEDGLGRLFRGDYEVLDLPTLEAAAGEATARAVNDVVAASSTLGRMVHLGWSIGGEDLGELPCDGVICATPSGSTAYNLSNGGPVLVWGLEALALTFIAPHSLHARPLVVPRGKDVVVENRTPNVVVTLLADGLPWGELSQGDSAAIRIAEERSLLATLPERTFFRRYRETFTT